jgi:hypothetical protein
MSASGNLSTKCSGLLLRSSFAILAARTRHLISVDASLLGRVQVIKLTSHRRSVAACLMVYRLTKESRKFRNRTLIASVARRLRPVWHCECEVGHTRDGERRNPKNKIPAGRYFGPGIELERAVAGLMTKASLDGSPRSPPIPRAVHELRQNAMETSPALAGFFLFRRTRRLAERVVAYVVT